MSKKVIFPLLWRCHLYNKKQSTISWPILCGSWWDSVQVKGYPRCLDTPNLILGCKNVADDIGLNAILSNFLSNPANSKLRICGGNKKCSTQHPTEGKCLSPSLAGEKGGYDFKLGQKIIFFIQDSIPNETNDDSAIKHYKSWTFTLQKKKNHAKLLTQNSDLSSMDPGYVLNILLKERKEHVGSCHSPGLNLCKRKCGEINC